MLKGVNDSLADAKALVRLLAGIPAKINLIPFNPWPGAPYECSDWEQIERFAEVREPRRLCQPGAHAARPRHHGRLRPAEVGERQAARQRRGASMRHRAAAGSRATCSGRPPAASSSSFRSRCCWRRRPRGSCWSRWAEHVTGYLHVNGLGTRTPRPRRDDGPGPRAGRRRHRHSDAARDLHRRDRPHPLAGLLRGRRRPRAGRRSAARPHTARRAASSSPDTPCGRCSPRRASPAASSIG